MTDLKTAAQQALEALEFDGFTPEDATHRQYTTKAITALKAALADGDNLSPTEPFSPDWDRIQPLQENLREHMAEIHRLRAALAEPVQEPDVPETNFGNMEPVAWLWQHRETGRTRVLMPDERTATDVAAAWDVVGPLYLAPPQRKPLTEEEIGIICASLGFAQISPVEVARAIESAHGIT